MKRLSDVKEWVGGMDICGMPGIDNGGQEVGGSGREGVVGRSGIYLMYIDALSSPRAVLLPNQYRLCKKIFKKLFITSHYLCCLMILKCY